MVAFHIPGSLRGFADGAGLVEIDCAPDTARDALEVLFARCPGLRDRVLDEQGGLRPHVNVFVGDECVRFTGGLETPMSGAREVFVIPAVSGGADRDHPDTRPVPSLGPPTLLRRWARKLLALLGWRVEIAWPPVPKCVIIVYPHTSNWDFLLGYLAKIAVGIPAHWIGKDTLFRWPVAGLLRRMGGIPVNRRESTGLIGQLAREFERRSWMWLALAPEGTRSYADHWKSGFYHLALKAKVPLGLAFIDYRARVLGLETYLTLTGDEKADLESIREVYAGKVGKHPDQAGEIRLRPERTP